MLKARFDSKEINKILGNTVQYGYGFLEGADVGQIEFNTQLGHFTTEALGKYIDTMARMHPQELHHVYEWNQVGNEGSRLFKLSSRATKRTITITGQFLPSKSIPDGGREAFKDKANVMENRIEVVIEPKNSDVLAFEVDGETVFTRNAIYIASPGGEAVAGSFGHTVDMFFTDYFTNAFLRSSGVFQHLESAKEFTNSFAAGTRSGKATGILAGRKYMTMPAGVALQ